MAELAAYIEAERLHMGSLHTSAWIGSRPSVSVDNRPHITLYINKVSGGNESEETGTQQDHVCVDWV